ncbi:hypothetical protein [Flavobacterium aquicola]|uniref:Uncharacterized protein n=1 Tax=Flavobacterium aquicola TaxID=1682742 RepID=A0A3E0EUB0_9FLAO|nr:hypothetical protein [Flavobacterium aquicola]REH01758.1 hypothetical protein C8P67_101240 [Flavobacterium aquicola]
MRRTKYDILLTLFSLLLIPILLSCEEHIETCVINPISPNLTAKELKEGNLSTIYNENIEFEMKNARVEEYNISQITIEGNFPENINYNSSNGKIILNGIPVRKGIYEFKITIRVTENVYGEQNKNMCGDTATESYTIIIN